ncbi:MAG: pentapeptide repeat-containing protein, partial [Mangrovicoccus sp.]
VIGGGAVMLERWRKTRRNRSSEYRAPKGRSWAQWRHNMRRLFSGLFWRDHYLKVVIPLGLGLVVWAALRLGGVLSQMTDGILGHLGQAISWGQADNVRSYTYALVALLGLLTLAANIPFRLIRVWTNERDTLAREEGLITDRIAKAVEGLGAEKTVKVIVTGEDGASETEERTEPNIEVRLGAIYALERIAQDSARDHVQVMEILCAYLRQNSPAEKAAKDPALSEFPSYPENASKEAVGDWREKIETWRKELGTALAEIPKPRQDLQVAITVLSRRRAKRRCQEGIYDRKGNWQGYRLDLRETDLRKFDLGKGHFDHANFSGANLQGAKLVGAEMQGANLSEARMQRADLQWAEMQ